jgi:glycosyltransferase involved in cell wall biosynthesis
VGASRKSLEIFRGFGVAQHRVFQSCLCVDNGLYAPGSIQDKPFDVMFAGQLIPRKMPLFYIEVARELAQRLGRCRVLLIGSGPLEQQARRSLLAYSENIEATMPGFVQPEQIPLYYRQSKLFLFPSLQDSWGVVANEAAAAGLPIITTPQTGVVGELVQHGVNGFVIAPQKDLWANAVQHLLEDKADYERMARSSLDIVSHYTRASAAKGIHDAALCAVSG